MEIPMVRGLKMIEILGIYYSYIAALKMNDVIWLLLREHAWQTNILCHV